MKKNPFKNLKMPSLNFGVMSEVKQVTWPSARQTALLTAYVIVATALLGLLTIGLDFVFREAQGLLF